MRKKKEVYTATFYDDDGKPIGWIPNIVRDDNADYKKGKPLDYNKYRFDNPDCTCLKDDEQIIVSGKCPIHKPIIL